MSKYIFTLEQLTAFVGNIIEGSNKSLIEAIDADHEHGMDLSEYVDLNCTPHDSQEAIDAALEMGDFEGVKQDDEE